MYYSYFPYHLLQMGYFLVTCDCLFICFFFTKQFEMLWTDFKKVLGNVDVMAHCTEIIRLCLRLDHHLELGNISRFFYHYTHE